MSHLNHNMPLIFLSEPAGRVFALDTQTLLSIGINLFNVALLAFVLSKILYNPVKNFMASRALRIKNQLESAENDSQAAAALKLEYELKLGEINIQRDAILEEATKLAADNRVRMLAEAKVEVEALKSRAAAEIEGERERAREEMRGAIIEISALMAEKMICKSMTNESSDRLFDEAMAELEEITWRS